MAGSYEALFDGTPPDGQERHFGLTEPPFSLTSNPKYLVESRSHAEALEQMTRALQRHEPLVVITGRPGTGKTLLCRLVATRLDPQTMMALITTPPISFEDFLRLILDDFGVLTKDSRSAAQASRFELVRTLRLFLASLAPLNASAVIIVDEAHRLTTEILEEVRALTNLETDRKKLLQIILVGEPSLEAALSPQFLQRVTRRHTLQPLHRAEVRGYIERRMMIARVDDGQTWGMPFTPSAIDAVATVSGGIPRVINVLCDRALEKAAEREAAQVDIQTLREAADALHLRMPARVRPGPRQAMAAALIVLTIAVAAIGLRFAPRRQLAATVATPAVSSQPAEKSPSPPPDAPVSTAAAAPTETASEPVSTSAVQASPAPISAVSTSTEQPQGGPLGRADSFAVVMSSFRTPGRALAFVDELRGRDHPAFWRAASGWEQVLVGPYASRQDATAARDRLVNEHPGDSPVIANVKGDLVTPTAGPALLAPGGRVSIWLDAGTDQIRAQSLPADNDRTFAVEVGPLATPLEPRTLAAGEGTGIVQSVAVRDATHADGQRYSKLIVTARVPIVGRSRVEGRGVYVDIDIPRTVAPRAPEGATASVADAPPAVPAPSADWKADLLQRANALAERPDVKRLLELRARSAAKIAALPPEEHDALVAQLDGIIEEAQRRQLKLDALLFSSEAKAPKAR